MIAPSEKSAFSVRAIARLYGVSRGTISDAIRSGELRAARLGKRRYLITKDDWLDFGPTPTPIASQRSASSARGLHHEQLELVVGVPVPSRQRE